MNGNPQAISLNAASAPQTGWQYRRLEFPTAQLMFYEDPAQSGLSNAPVTERSMMKLESLKL